MGNSDGTKYTLSRRTTRSEPEPGGSWDRTWSIEATAERQPPGKPDIAVKVQAEPDLAHPGQLITYTASITNQGNADAEDVAYDDALAPESIVGDLRRRLRAIIERAG